MTDRICEFLAVSAEWLAAAGTESVTQFCTFAIVSRHAALRVSFKQGNIIQTIVTLHPEILVSRPSLEFLSLDKIASQLVLDLNSGS